MIAFDNGPADGDYVRYIEAMAKVAATNAVQAAATPMASSASAATGFNDTSQARMKQVAIRRSAVIPAASATAAPRGIDGAGVVLPALGGALVLMAAGIVVGLYSVTRPQAAVVGLIAGIALFISGFRQVPKATTAIRDAARDRTSRA